MRKFGHIVVGAMSPRRYEDSYCEIYLLVWFEEIGGPYPFCASLFDPEGHGRALWFKAMAGHYGEIEVVERQPKVTKPEPVRMIEHDRKHLDIH